MAKHVSFRIDEKDRAALQTLARSSKRSQTEEIRAAIHLYLALADLADLKARLLSSDAPSERDYIGEDYRLKTQAAEAVIPALPRTVREAFEKDTGKALEVSVGSLEEFLLWSLNIDAKGEFQGVGSPSQSNERKTK